LVVGTEEVLQEQTEAMRLASFEAMVTALEPDAWRLALSIVRDHHEAEDAVAEAFVKAWRAMPSCGEIQLPRPWLMKIVRNVCLDALRRRRGWIGSAYDGEDDALLEGIADARPGPEAEIVSQEAMRSLWDRLGALPEADRTALVLRFWQDAAYDEIALVTGWRLGTVASRLSRAKEKLSKMLLTEKTPEWLERARVVRERGSGK
jgi:RNA polymerase sigma-70 factor (ECF subfamily)